MIQEKSGFWDSIDATPSSEGDERTYPASDVTIPFEYLVSDGVQTGGTKLQVSPGSYDYSTQIAPGMGWIKGKWYLLYDDGTGGTAARVLLHDAPIQYSRIDRVVLRYDANYTLEGRHIYAAIVKGEEAETPTAPALTRTGEIYEISLARVLIKPGQPAVLEADITDERFDGDLCGIAGFAPQPDLQPVIDAFTAQLQEYFAGIQIDVSELIAELQAGGLPANMLSTTPPMGQPGWVNGQAYLDGLKDMADTAVVNIDALEANNVPLTTGGTAPNYTVTDPTISAYAAGLRRTIKFNAAGSNVTLNFNGLGALGLYTFAGEAADAEAGQYVTVICDGASFFMLSGGKKKRLITEIIVWNRDWTVPRGVRSVNVRLFGGGSGGRDGGGGGAGGHMAYGVIDVTPGDIIPVTIGSGGNGGTSPTAGGVTSFGTLLSASGGGAPVGSVGGHGGTGGGGAGQAAGGNGSYGGGGGAGQYGGSYGAAGGTGGTYGGGGGSTDATIRTGGVGCGSGGSNTVSATAGTNTIGTGLEFEGTGAAGIGATNATRGGGGGYGGAGGTGGQDSRGGGAGGGGGYGAKGGNGQKYSGSSNNHGGGGGGGYGGCGGDEWGGGGGYGPAGNGGGNTGAGYDGGIAAGGSAGGDGGKGGKGIAILQYYV